ncbi:MAG: biotin/lipoyl-binding protein [Clostridia bacterium]|nr:biotin/lipoyl-binding protein [Clostridia bacterium]
MKAYKVTVNGNVYEITLEVIDKADIKAAPAPAAAPAEPAPAPAAPVAAPAAAPAAGATTVSAPMPGTILKVNVAAGQAIKRGDVLMILEAMKMENEIVAPVDGTVAAVSVNAGATVESGTVLCSIN